MTQAVGLVYALVAAIAFGIQYVPVPLQSCPEGVEPGCHGKLRGKTPSSLKWHHLSRQIRP